MKRFLPVMPVLFIILLTASCKKDSSTTTPPTSINFATTLSGANETPANVSTAYGTSTGVYNTTTKILTLSTTYTGVTVTAGHLHKGDPGVSGPVEFPFAVTASPIVFTSSALTATEETDLMENKYYVNLHSSTYPGGEIRGQLTKQ